MTDRSDQFRKAAVDCLKLARHTSDPRNSATLLLMAQIWFDRADRLLPQASLDAAVGVFNEGQLKPTRITQQQQQIQPKDEDEKG